MALHLLRSRYKVKINSSQGQFLMKTLFSSGQEAFLVALSLLLIPVLSSAQAQIELAEEFKSTASMVKQININPKINQAKLGEIISLSLKKDNGLKFSIKQVKTGYKGSKTISAFAPGGESLLLTIDEKVTYGSIRGNGLNYSISHSKQNGQILVDQNNDDSPTIDFSSDAMVPPGMSADLPGYLQMGYESTLLQKQQTKSISNITLMVLYSNEFANGFASPLTRINQMVAFVNQSYVRSNINIQFEVVHAQTLAFNNNENLGTLLTQITNGTGSFSGVGALRDQFGADMVALLPFQNTNRSAGIAWVNGGNPNLAYSVTQMSPNCCDVVFTHELGHNLGSGHERNSVNPSQSSPCGMNFTGFSCGYGSLSGEWGTVMSSSSNLRRGSVNNVHSNPSQTCLGEPCGIAQGQPNPADNTSSFNITGPLVAAFRADVSPPPPPPPNGSDPTVIVPVYELLLGD